MIDISRKQFLIANSEIWNEGRRIDFKLLIIEVTPDCEKNIFLTQSMLFAKLVEACMFRYAGYRNSLQRRVISGQENLCRTHFNSGLLDYKITIYSEWKIMECHVWNYLGIEFYSKLIVHSGLL